MKDNGSMLGVEDYLWAKTPADHKDPDAVLLEKYLNDYADYFVEYIQSYAAVGIPVSAVTVQNEPYHTTADYPSMHMPAEQCREFVKVLGVEFAAEKIETKILVWDHNYTEKGKDGSFYPEFIYNDLEARNYVAGSAWHGYSGDASVMGKLSKRYPGKELYFTEQTGERGFSHAQNIAHFMADTFMPALEGGAQTLMAWNIALNEEGGPRLRTVQWTKAQGLITVDSKTPKWTTESEYAAIGHFSSFIRAGAQRIQATVHKNRHLLASGFINPNNTVVCVLFNNRLTKTELHLVIGDRAATIALGGYTAATVVMPAIK